MKTYILYIDALDRITGANAEWFAFASENSPTDLGKKNVIGKSLMEFIGDEETRHLYHLLFDRVRRRQQTIELPFRCDSPDVRRFMTMRLAPMAEKAIRIETEIVREEPRPPVRMPAAGQVRSNAILHVCSWCKRIETPTGWYPVEDAVAQLKLFDQIPLPVISHGVCPDCLITVRREIEAMDIEEPDDN